MCVTDEILAIIAFGAFFLVVGISFLKRSFRSDLVDSLAFKDPFSLRSISKHWKGPVVLVFVFSILGAAILIFPKCGV